jgi:hypothetical protein
MKKQSLVVPVFENELVLTSDSAPVVLPAAIPTEVGHNLVRMFRDPYVLEKQERTDLIQQLRSAVALEPNVSELRVLLGMALCVNFEAQAALEELRESVRLDPDNFIARLKFGELLMRLRICPQAAEETQIAAKLATTPIQAELARRQSAAIRTMLREGIERGGYGKVLSVFDRIGRLFTRSEQNRNAVALNSR